ncbi:hypothetical protein ZWY2020_016870 [Hordeum vulgare]|nr:hypothetical protein ZWY2020_016870 [Hordeum vulgare]
MHTLHFSNKTCSKIPSLGLALLLLLCWASPASCCTDQEKGALLQFLAQLSQDHGLSATWRNTTDCCNWEGITCRQDRTVTHVLLPSKGLEGHISQSLGNLTWLQHLDLSDNSLSGGLPLGLVSSRSITTLDVSFNQLNGTLQEMLASSSTPGRPLQVLNISSNLFVGQFPSTTWKAMENLRALNASNNSFTGQIPTQLCSTFPSLEMLDLCFNKFSGRVPPGLGDCSKLRELRAGFNRLSGQIPQSICNLTNLQVLDLSSNNLTGAIPAALNTLNFLSKFNISSNDLEGPIPSGGQFNTFQNSSFNGNPKLCGSMLTHKCGKDSISPSSRKKRDKKAVFAIAFGVFFGGIAILLLLARLLVSIRQKGFTGKNRRESNGDAEESSFSSSSEQTLVVVRIPQGKGVENKLKFADILKATNNFDKANIIGCGGHGLVYKAELSDGSRLAIKKLNGEMCLMEREFSAEVDALSRAQHENLVPLWGYCVQGNSSFGVVLLELLTGRRPVSVFCTPKELVPWVLQMRSEGKQIEVMDPTLKGTGYEEQMLKVLEAACKCVDHNQFRRPTIMEVVSCLSSIKAEPEMQRSANI